MTSVPVLRDQRGSVRWLRLNRPHRRNALDPDLIEALDRELSDAERDPDTVSVLVIAGEGKSFCAGADLEHLLRLSEQGRSPLELMTRISAVFTRLEVTRLPVVAAVHGHAVAGGLEMALACDVVVAADDALLGDGHVRNNLLPGGGASVRLPRRLGPNWARYLMLTGDLVPASQLQTAGWLHSVVPGARLEEEVSDVADRLVAAAGAAQSRVKPLLADVDGTAMAAGSAAELAAFDAHWKTAAISDVLRHFFAERSKL